MPRLALTAWTLIAKAAGTGIGLLTPDFGKQLTVVASVFLRLIKSVIAPLLFGLLLPSVARAGNARDLGRLGFGAVVYFEIATAIALA